MEQSCEIDDETIVKWILVRWRDDWGLSRLQDYDFMTNNWIFCTQLCVACPFECKRSDVSCPLSPLTWLYSSSKLSASRARLKWKIAMWRDLGGTEVVSKKVGNYLLHVVPSHLMQNISDVKFTTGILYNYGLFEESWSVLFDCPRLDCISCVGGNCWAALAEKSSCCQNKPMPAVCSCHH